MISRRKRNNRVISQTVRGTLLLHNVRISNSRAVHSHNTRRIRRRTNNSQLTTLVFLILAKMTRRQYRSNSKLNKNTLRNISRRRLLRRPLISQINITLRRRRINTSGQLHRPRVRLAINRIMYNNKRRISTRVLDRFVNGLEVYTTHRRNRSLVKYTLGSHQRIFPLFPSVISLPFAIIVHYHARALSGVRRPTIPEKATNYSTRKFFRLQRNTHDEYPIPNRVVPVDHHPT